MSIAFETIEEILENMLYSMDGNDEFLNLIYIDKRDALTLPTPIIAYKDLVMERLFPMEHIVGPNEEAKSMIAIDFLDCSPSLGSDDIYKVRFTVDVISCTDDETWLLNGGKLRMYRLSDIVLSSILSLEYPTLSMDVKLQSSNKMYYDNNRKFKGIRMIFSWEIPS